MLLHRTADRVGLPARLRGALASSPWMLDRANALVGLAVGIALGARSVRQAELLARHHAAPLGDGASDSTLWRVLGEIDARARGRIAKARARSGTCSRHARRASRGWRSWLQITVTNIDDLGRAVPGSHHVFFLDAAHRQHASVEDRVRTEKATGVRNLPFKGYARNQAWLLAANIASDLLAYLRLLGLDQERDLARAEPESLRAMILHIPARLVHHARQRILKIEASRPWAAAFQTCRQRLTALPDPG